MTFTKIGCEVKYRGKTVLQGHKDNATGLWMVNLKGNGPPKNIANPFVPAIHKIAEHFPKQPNEDELQDALQVAANALEVLLSTT